MQKEINRYLKLINAAKLKKNHKECIELYNIVGGLYSDIGSYDEACHYHEQALAICHTIGDYLSKAMTLRYIGESKASLSQFSEATSYIKKYLELAQKINHKVEIQRAWTTLGRVHLMEAQDLKENAHFVDDKIRQVAKEAEKKFQTALNLADSVRDQVDEREFAQMKSGLLINIGLVKDICGDHTETVQKFNRAIEMCKSAKLKEDLYRCHIILTSIFRQRNNITMAARHSEEALISAKQIGKKILICDAYIETGLVRICQRDFKNAKRTFAQAYLEKSPNEEDHLKAIRLTKLSHLIASTHEQIRDDTPSEKKLKLCDKLGDLFVAINLYKLAVEFYKKAYKEARISCKPNNEKARILFSIAETYADDGLFDHAIVCYKKELEYRNGNEKEQCQSLLKIAHMHEYMNDDTEKVISAYEKAYEKTGKDLKLKYNVLKDYVPYMKKNTSDSSRYKELDCVLINLKSFREVAEEIGKEGDEEVNELEEEIANVDDIITDDEDNDEVLMIGRKKSRGAKKFKSNEVGETPLHEACIKGDLKRVKSLISQGHEINPRDNAGWTPLHEACNHGHYDIVEYLIERGADVSNRGLKGMSPLHDAATNGHYEIMRLLIRNGANVIALTDSGETVLSCLRDYKNRNYFELPERDRSEYKQIEIELIDIMDRCGYNVMEESIKNLGKSKGGSSSNSSRAALEESTQTTRPKQRMNVLAAKPMSNPVREYKDAIKVGGKRKRDTQESSEVLGSKRASNLPATYQTKSNPSVPTKQWLVDDNVAEVTILDSSSDEDDVNFIPKSPPIRSSHSPVQTIDSFDTSPQVSPAQATQEDFFAMSPQVFSPGDIQESSSSMAPSTNSNSCSNQKSNNDTNQSSAKAWVVNIEDVELLVPIEDDQITVGALKESIVDIYSTMVGARAKISLAPLDRPARKLFDGHLCANVIDRGQSLLASIESWELESIDKYYEAACDKLSVSPLNYIKAELKRHSSVNKLDLAYSRYPRSHIKLFVEALARRDFTHANLAGSTLLFEPPGLGHDVLYAIGTWRKLIELNLKCVGLTRQHFESICAKMKLPGLRSLDLSFNVIVYKRKEAFKKQIESLLEACPSLERLDVRRNHLQFVVQNLSKPVSGRAGMALEKEGGNSCGSGGEMNLSKTLELASGEAVEILGADQYDYVSL